MDVFNPCQVTRDDGEITIVPKKSGHNWISPDGKLFFTIRRKSGFWGYMRDGMKKAILTIYDIEMDQYKELEVLPEKLSVGYRIIFPLTVRGYYWEFYYNQKTDTYYINKTQDCFAIDFENSELVRENSLFYLDGRRLDHIIKTNENYRLEHVPNYKGHIIIHVLDKGHQLIKKIKHIKSIRRAWFLEGGRVFTDSFDEAKITTL